MCDVCAMGPSTDDCGGGTGDARFERLGMRCGVTFAEPSDSGCVASSSLTAMSNSDSVQNHDVLS